MSVLRCNLTYTVKVLFDILSPLIKTHFLDGFSFLGMFLFEKCVKGGGHTLIMTQKYITLFSRNLCRGLTIFNNGKNVIFFT